VPREERAVFAVGATLYRRRELVDAAAAWGEWAGLTEAAREELACRVRADTAGDPLAAGALSAAGAAFRRSRGLLAAEDVQDWLAERDLAVGDWFAHLRGELLRDAWRDHLAEIAAAAGAPEPAELARATWVRAVCTGTLSRVAERLAAGAAALAELSAAERRRDGACDVSGPDGELRPGDVGPEALARLEAAAHALVRRAATGDRLGREVEAHRVGWTSADCTILAHPSLDVLREAALCVTEDGMTLDAAAREARAELLRSRLVVEELPEALAARVFAAEPGELLEPELVGDVGWLVLVEAKTIPSVADPALRERAATLIAARERARASDVWVRWFERI
jgi:hypothetical protein